MTTGTTPRPTPATELPAVNMSRNARPRESRLPAHLVVEARAVEARVVVRAEARGDSSLTIASTSVSRTVKDENTATAVVFG